MFGQVAVANRDGKSVIIGSTYQSPMNVVVKWPDFKAYRPLACVALPPQDQRRVHECARRQTRGYSCECWHRWCAMRAGDMGREREREKLDLMDFCIARASHGYFRAPDTH